MRFNNDVATHVTFGHIFLRPRQHSQCNASETMMSNTLHAMHTRNSPPQAKDKLPIPPSLEATVKASWEPSNEIAFIDYIADHKAEAGDAMKFKASFWNGAADHMKAYTTTGGPKTTAGCAAKWDRVCDYIVCNE